MLFVPCFVPCRHKRCVVLEDGILQLLPRIAGVDFVEIFVIHSRRLVDEAQEPRHKMLFQVVVDSGVHLRGEVG